MNAEQLIDQFIEDAEPATNLLLHKLRTIQKGIWQGKFYGVPSQSETVPGVKESIKQALAEFGSSVEETSARLEI